MKQNYWLNRVKKKKGFVYYYRLNRESGLVDKDTLGLPKSNKKRKIPVVYSVVEPIKASQEESVRTGPEDLVFCYDDGSRLSVTYWKNNFKKALNKAGLDWKDRNLTPHSLRHSLNSHLLF
ncbi:Tyrosine recombinase XerC [subsurface metagenome]